MPLPPRTADTMSDAIAIASPNGRLSKRAHEQAMRRLGLALFGTGNDLKGDTPQPTAREQHLRQAKRLRALAAAGMSPRKFTKEAIRLETLAETL